MLGGDFASSRTQLEAALELNSGDEKLLILLSSTCRQLGDFAASLTHLDRRVATSLTRHCYVAAAPMPRSYHVADTSLTLR